jgi:hypothetical protein
MKVYAYIVIAVLIGGAVIFVKHSFSAVADLQSRLALAEKVNQDNAKTIESMKANAELAAKVLKTYNVDVEAIQADKAKTNEAEKKVLVNNEAARNWHGANVNADIVELFNRSINRISDGARLSAGVTATTDKTD